MFEITVSVNIHRNNCLEKLRQDVLGKVNFELASIVEQSKYTAFVRFGTKSSNKTKLVKIIKSCLIELFLSDFKYDYIYSHLNCLGISIQNKKLLCHALTGFDSDCEAIILSEILDFSGNNVSIDGYYNFSLGEVKDRWQEICTLSQSHMAYLYDQNSFDELLRYLIEAGKSSQLRAEIYNIDGYYKLLFKSGGNVIEELTTKDFSVLLCRLIDLAPKETILYGFDYDDAYRRLYTIFDVKTHNFV